MSDERLSSAGKEYLKILLQQYSECWEGIRSDSNSVWQIPTLLITTISVLGLAYIQLYQIPITQLSQIQTARILILLVGFGFTLVSLIALVKHRVSCNSKTQDFYNIQRQLKRLLEQKEFKSFFEAINKDDEENQRIQFREIKFENKDIAKNFKFTKRSLFGKLELKEECFANERLWFYRRSAYDWQLSFTIMILFGIAVLLAREFWLQGLWFLILFEVVAFLCFWFGVFWEGRLGNQKKRDPTASAMPTKGSSQAERGI
jgi:hypothetical protein